MLSIRYCKRNFKTCLKLNPGRHQLASQFSALQQFDRNAFLDSINVKTFSDEEINDSFNLLKSPEGHIVASDITKVIGNVTRKEFTDEEVNIVASNLLEDLDTKNTGEISRESWESGLRILGKRFDSRVKPLVACYLITGGWEIGWKGRKDKDVASYIYAYAHPT